jgi:hypothetical protein
MEQTVEEKLDYLLETKALIRNAIISKGQTITDDTPFRDYVNLILAIKTSEDLETQLNAQDAVIAQQQARITELENIIAGFTA